MGSNNKMYTRLCEGLNDKGKLIPKDDDIYKHIKDPKKDYYISVYNYNAEQKEKFDKDHTVAGIRDVTTNRLVFDFDSEDLDQSRKDTVETVSRLKKIGVNPDDMNVYFSGGKGFHIVLNTDCEFTPEQAKKVALKVAKGLKTFDSVVYNPARIFRLPFTKHQSSGLYKIPLELRELETLKVEEIKTLAKEQYEPEVESNVILKSTKLEGYFHEKEQETSVKPKSESSLLAELDLTKRPKFLSPWKFALEQGFFPPKQRSNALIILASTYKALGYNKTKCYYALKASAELQAERFDQDKFSKDEIYRNVIQPVFSNSWTGGTYAEDNFPEQIKEYLKELGVPRQDEQDLHENFVVDINKGFDSFAKYATNIDENTMKFGIPALDNVLRVQVGHLIGILAGPGIGKTSMALTLLNNTSKEGVKSFFGSYDMAGNILIQKLVQRETRLSTDEIYDVYRNKNTKEIDRFQKVLQKNYNNVSFCFKSGQSVDELRESIRVEEEKLGEEIKLVIVDYLELIRAKSSDPTQASAEAIQGLREIANEGKVVVCLLQPNKMSSTPDEPLLTYNAAKGSSAIAQAVTAMITCHRVGYSSDFPENDKFFNINIVKNRLGPLGKADFAWDGPTGRIRELEDIERMELKELRNLKKAEKGDDF
jgi:replicative DNA helicase